MEDLRITARVEGVTFRVLVYIIAGSEFIETKESSRLTSLC